MAGSRASGLSGLLRILAVELPLLSPAALVVGLLVCLLVPLPTAIVDLLLSASLAGAVLMLVASLRVARAAEFLVFPTLVLLLALSRLALNTSTTRLILSQADAGRVIDAFAGLVTRGDLLVGAVMFAVITAIQYFVIARGAERVAEVAARFALDGMPGQQAAIEADLRAGAISAREAQARRAGLNERSEFFARMDGVMRWVKGDAIVGVLITAINLVGGVAVGSARAGLGVGESLALYGRLAIGDGLLAQLPALLIALAAAVLVARVDRVSEAPRTPWLEPAMLIIPAALLGALALVPGMPHLAFATTSAGLIAAAAWIAARRRQDSPAAPREAEIRVRLRLSDPEAQAALDRDLAGLRRRCAAALAIPIPRLRVEAIEGDGALGPDAFELRLGGRVLGRGSRDLGRDLAHDLDGIVVGCFRIVMDSAEGLLDLESIEAQLEATRRRHPSLVRQAMRSVEPVDLLAILRAFVRERIPAPSMDALIEVLAEGRVFHDPSERPRWSEHAREALADHWVHDLCDGVAALGQAQWLRPSADFEDALLARAAVREQRVDLALTPAEREQMVTSLLAEGLEGRDSGAPRARLLLCGARARAAFASLLAGTRPHIPVLAVGELASARVDAPPSVLVDLPG